MPVIDIPLQSGENATEQLTGERLVNLYTEPAPKGARAPFVLQPHPGLVPFGYRGPVYGLAVHRGELYVATGGGLFRIEGDGTATSVEYSGSIHATGTTILYNGIDFYCSGVAQAAYLDGYFLRVEPDYAGRFSWAGPYSSDWQPLDFATAEGSPDGLVGIIAAHRELWLFGESTTEIWYNAGSTDRPFQRMSSAFVERGASGGMALVGPSPYWLGDDGLVYRGKGYQPERISTSSVEQRIARQSDTPAGFSVTIGGHQLYVLRFAGLCLCYDTTTSLWHERNTWQSNTWEATNGAHLDGVNYVGGAGGLFRLSPTTYTDNGQPIERMIVTPPLFVPDDYARMGRVELLAQMGPGLTTGQGSQPQAMLRWSDDGGQTWSHEHWRNIGPIGAYIQRARWWRMGRFRERCFDVRVTDPVRVSILGMSAVAYG